MTAFVSPVALAEIARRAEAGDADATYKLGVAMTAVQAWDAAGCQAFAQMIDVRTTAFLRREFAPLIDRHVHLAVLLRETEAVRNECTPQNLRRWDLRAGRVA